MLPPRDNPSLENIVELAQAGDREAFTILFQRYNVEIYGYLAGLVGDREEAHDLTQKTFLKAWQKLLTLHKVSRFKPWLYRIARNLAYDHRKLRSRDRSQPWQKLDEHATMLSQPGPEESVAQTELVRLALAKVSPKKVRECLLLATLA